MNQIGQAVVLYSAVLRPHRSLTRQASTRIVLATGATSLAIAAPFIAAGAWPVLPFMGLEVLLLFFFLRLNQRAGNACEAINLTPMALTVHRTDHWGKQSSVSLPADWLQVHLEPISEVDNRLQLRTHGRCLTIASFLAPREREELVVALRRALARLQPWRQRMSAA